MAPSLPTSDCRLSPQFHSFANLLMWFAWKGREEKESGRYAWPLSRQHFCRETPRSGRGGKLPLQPGLLPRGLQVRCFLFPWWEQVKGAWRATACQLCTYGAWQESLPLHQWPHNGGWVEVGVYLWLLQPWTLEWPCAVQQFPSSPATGYCQADACGAITGRPLDLVFRGKVVLKREAPFIPHRRQCRSQLKSCALFCSAHAPLPRRSPGWSQHSSAEQHVCVCGSILGVPPTPPQTLAAAPGPPLLPPVPHGASSTQALRSQKNPIAQSDTLAATRTLHCESLAQAPPTPFPRKRPRTAPSLGSSTDQASLAGRLNRCLAGGEAWRAQRGLSCRGEIYARSRLGQSGLSWPNAAPPYWVKGQPLHLPLPVLDKGEELKRRKCGR